MTDKITTKQVLNIIKEYCAKYNISLSRFAHLAGVSKAWLSRLMNENEKKISLLLAEKLLNVAGYSLKIVKQNDIKISYNRLRKKHGQIIR